MVLMMDHAQKKPQGRPKQPKELLPIEGIAVLWDDEVRDRLRSGGPLMSPDCPNLTEDITTCVKNRFLLHPILARMSLMQTRPLPAIEGLRDEVEKVFCRNKRSTSELPGGDIVKCAWHIRKLLGFIKMKVRRHEVSTVTCQKKHCWRGPLIFCGLRYSAQHGTSLANDFNVHLRFLSFSNCAWSWTVRWRQETRAGVSSCARLARGAGSAVPRKAVVEETNQKRQARQAARGSTEDRSATSNATFIRDPNSTKVRK